MKIEVEYKPWVNEETFTFSGNIQTSDAVRKNFFLDEQDIVPDDPDEFCQWLTRTYGKCPVYGTKVNANFSRQCPVAREAAIVIGEYYVEPFPCGEYDDRSCIIGQKVENVALNIALSRQENSS